MLHDKCAGFQNARSGRTFVETYIALAQISLHEHRPRYKLRPKFHQFHCQCVLALVSDPDGGAGARLNPRHFSGIMGVFFLQYMLHPNTYPYITLSL